jgi:peptidoglycan-associated lipoprotein
MRSRFHLWLLPVALAMGCANNPTPRSPEPPTTQTATKRTQGISPATPNVGVASDLARMCNIVINNVAEAPKFDFDSTGLSSQDRDILSQVAKCVTMGPLRGRALYLVGRADARGEAEYNLALGDHRAGSVRSYLRDLGVDDRRLAETSRGKLDATGKDEEGWRRDRRVDIILQ